MKGFFKVFAGAFVALMLVIIMGVNQSADAGPAEGKTLFTAKNCGSCHLTTGPNTDKSFEDKLKHKGPDLWFAGSKFKLDWLEEWLKDPKPIRPMEYNTIDKKNAGNHPKLPANEAHQVTEYLNTLKSKDVAEGVIEEGKPNIQGKIAFEKKQGCYGCHSLKKAGKVVGGLTGPSLVDAGKRLKGDWIYAYLKNPKALIPIKRMPIYTGILNDNDMKAAAQYITTFK